MVPKGTGPGKPRFPERRGPWDAAAADMTLATTTKTCCEADEEDEDDDDEDPAVLKKKILISAILLVAAVIVTRVWEFPLLVQFIFFLPSYLVAGGSVLKEAGENIVEGHPFDEDFLMAVATVGALLIGFIPGGEPMWVASPCSPKPSS